MKVHVGADVNSGVVHTVSVTPANTADITELPDLLRLLLTLLGGPRYCSPKAPKSWSAPDLYDAGR
jgi:hypothetical protein